MMTGRLDATGRVLASLANDLSDANATPQEREIAAILTAASAAILLGATGSLAEVVAPWWEEQAVEAVKVIAAQRRDID
jgi:hypothetical protein